MRQLAILLSIFLFATCDDKIEYSDLSGKWRFQSDTFSGEFQIEKAPDGKFFARGGTFTINGKQYSNIRTHEIAISNFSISPNILMSDTSYKNILGLVDVTFSDNFKTMTSQRQVIQCDTCAVSQEVNQKLIITRY